MIAVALLLWPNTARVIRTQVLTVRERAYVEAARVTGASTWRILFVHVAPNILPLSFLYGSVAIGWAILTEAAVSFLGFGDPTRMSWGFMLQDAFVSQALSRGAWHWFLPPGICIMLVVVAGFFISRGAEEVLFPKLRELTRVAPQHPLASKTSASNTARARGIDARRRRRELRRCRKARSSGWSANPAAARRRWRARSPA